MVFHFRAVSPNTTSGAQAALMTTWQSCDCYLPPVNGHSLCLTFFSYAFAPSFFVPYFYFSVYFSILAFSSLFALLLIAFPFALFCSSAKPLLNPRTIRGFSYTKKPPAKAGSFRNIPRQKPGASEISPVAAELPHRRGHNVFTKGADGNSGQARRSSRGTGCPPRRRRARPPPFPTPWWNRRRASFRNRVGSPRG